MADISSGAVHITVAGTISKALQTAIQVLRDIRKLNITVNTINEVDVEKSNQIDSRDSFFKQIKVLASLLSASGRSLEAGALLDVCELGITSTDFGGLGLHEDSKDLSEQDFAELLFLVSAHLEALNSAERASDPVKLLSHRPPGRRGMTLSEKIFAAHDVSRKGEVKPGDVIRVDVDWIMASELSWKGMEYWYDRMGKPGIHRNDRFWLAGDHLVDPRILEHPKIKPYVESSERAKRDFKMTENQGMNYTIMHTEFCRERAQPGMIVIGSDSHTCSAGSMSCLAVGLGVADVLLPLITGETWFKIPETIEIRFINKPKPGLGGKDIILYILKELKRNTVAAERVVEYTGPGVKYLSCDARFAIANMTTEFGGVSGIFVPDATTQEYINKRKKPKHRSRSIYFRPDEDAQYVESHIINLYNVESFVARYPKPDDVVPVAEMAGLELNGCFIGACTTAEEDLVLGALVLEQGLKRGARPAKGPGIIRKLVPGSLPILHKLRELGLAAVYEEAGWEIGAPSCSYCVGASADKAQPGEVWLSSQNRNFENRMGPGAFGHLASAVTVAASSFDMKITDPAPLLDAIDIDRLHTILGTGAVQNLPRELEYVEPGMVEAADEEASSQQDISSTKKSTETTSQGQLQQTTISQESHEPNALAGSDSGHLPSAIQGKVAVLPDFIDTDALAPTEAMAQVGLSVEGFGTYCLHLSHPEFRQKVKDGQNIVVAGEAFGCGSSREQAVWALQGTGVKCVIAKSFAFIYARNQPNLGLLGIEIPDPLFHEKATDGTNITVDVDQLVAVLDLGHEKLSFPFQLSTMQRRLLECGGAENAFGRYGKNLWKALTAPSPNTGAAPTSKGSGFPRLQVDAKKTATEW